MRDKQVEWAKLQAAYRKASGIAADYQIDLRSKYGDAAYCTATERAKLRALWERTNKASDRCLAWLKANSPWDWYSGTALIWICTKLSFETAIQQTPPTLPADARAYGYPYHEYQPVRLED